MAQQQTTATASVPTSSVNNDTKLASAFQQQANISQPQSSSSNQQQYYGSSQSKRHLGRHHSKRHPYDRESVFDTQAAFQKHNEVMQQLRSAAAAQGTTGGNLHATGLHSTGLHSTQAKSEPARQLTEAETKAAKEEEKAELLKFEAVRNEVNQLIASQDWNKMEVQHVHNLGTQLRQLEHKFWNLKPIAEQLVLKGRNKLAERIDLAEEELLHAILVVSQIYRNRVMDAAHTRFPGKIHPQYLQRDHENALRHAHVHRAAQHHAYSQDLAAHHHYQRSQAGYYVPVGRQSGYEGSGYGGSYGGGYGGGYGGRPHIGHGHPGHFGYDGDESYGAVPYHGHPHQGYGGYY